MRLVHVPGTDNALLLIFRIERLPESVNGFIDLVDIAIRDLKRLRIAVNRPDGMLHDVASGFKAYEGPLNLFCKEIELSEIGVQHFHLGTLFGVRRAPWRDHNVAIAKIKCSNDRLG